MCKGVKIPEIPNPRSVVFSLYFINKKSIIFKSMRVYTGPRFPASMLKQQLYLYKFEYKLMEYLQLKLFYKEHYPF